MDSPLATLEKQISKLKKALDKCNGDAYRGAWLDTVKDRTGTKVYYRLRWFKPDGGKGCRTLKPNEVGEAQRALELWLEVEKLEAERDRLQCKIDKHLSIAESLGAPPHRKSSFEAMTSSESNEWYTPPEFIELARAVMGGIDIDPASNERTQEWIQAKVWYGIDDDGFNRDWHGRLWLNPPYGHPKPKLGIHGAGDWIQKAIAAYDAGNVTQAVLLVRGDSKGVKELVRRFPQCETSERIQFIAADPSKGGNAPPTGRFFYMGERISEFYKHFCKVGSINEPSQIVF